MEILCNRSRWLLPYPDLSKFCTVPACFRFILRHWYFVSSCLFNGSPTCQIPCPLLFCPPEEKIMGFFPTRVYLELKPVSLWSVVHYPTRLGGLTNLSGTVTLGSMSDIIVSISFFSWLISGIWMKNTLPSALRRWPVFTSHSSQD